jgi:hypothetical protein
MIGEIGIRKEMIVYYATVIFHPFPDCSEKPRKTLKEDNRDLKRTLLWYKVRFGYVIIIVIIIS